jgi:hypothetical protein
VIIENAKHFYFLIKYSSVAYTRGDNVSIQGCAQTS